MRTLTATRFRANLYRTLRSIAGGGRIRITSKWGAVELVREPKALPASRKARTAALAPKIPGRIIGSLDSADRLLRKHIRMPK
jgi:hypothetical protein